MHPRTSIVSSRNRFVSSQQALANAIFETLEERQLFSTFTVTTEADAGAGSLRQAIIDANAAANTGGMPDVIDFNIDAPLGAIIQPLTELPSITEAVKIDGYTQGNAKENTAGQGDNAELTVNVDGSQATPGSIGIVIAADNVTVRGLNIVNFKAKPDGAGGPDIGGDGIDVTAGTGAAIEGNSILGNSGQGIKVSGASKVLIGGAAPAAMNLIGGNSNNGILLLGDDNTIQNNQVGVEDNVGIPNFNGNGRNGIDIIGNRNVIRGNVISRNDENGIFILGSGPLKSEGNVIAGNLIGVDVFGNAPFGNGGNGIALEDASNNTIGGTTAADRNVIGDNESDGIVISGTNGTRADHNTIIGNYIGVAADGKTNVGNTKSGVEINGAADNTVVGQSGAGNVIAGNGEEGILVSGKQDLQPAGTGIAGNLIGLAIDGDTVVGNAKNGMLIHSALNTRIGGATAGERNVISGNDDDGIRVEGQLNAFSINTQILGNFIGTNAAGTQSRANLGNGINTRQFSSNTHIGSDQPGAGNVISGNGDQGILFTGDVQSNNNNFNVVQGNIIGLDVTATHALPNEDGIDIDSSIHNLIGGTTPGARNIISGNLFNGIFTFKAAFTQIQGNLITLNGIGQSGQGSGGTGIFIEGSSNILVGGTTPEEANVIAFNGTPGVQGNAGVAIIAFNSIGELGIANAVRGNSIFANNGPAIDLNINGITPNDPLDADIDGGNELQNAPLIISATASASGDLAIKGILGSAPNRPYVIDFYINPTINPGGIVDAQTYLGSITVATDAGGNAQIDATLHVTVPPGQFVTATASDASTSPFVSTSELSPQVKVAGAVVVTPTPTPPAAVPELSVSDVSITEGNSGTKTVKFNVSMSKSSISPVTVNYATQNDTADSSDFFAKSGTLTFDPGITSKAVSITIRGDTKFENDEAFKLLMSNPAGATIADGTGVGTILNDDKFSKPKISIKDASTSEGKSGTKSLTFTITLDKLSDQAVTVDYSTADGSAKTGDKDYAAKQGTVTFKPGEKSKTITITINGDTKKESTESFYVNLKNSVNADLDDKQAKGTICNDD